MTIQHNGMLMRIYLGESRRHGHRPAFRAVVDALAGAGLAGVTVFKGVEGFGRNGVLSSERSVDAFADLPLLLEVVDDEQKIRGFVPTLEALLDGGLITLERIQTIVYRDGAEVAP